MTILEKHPDKWEAITESGCFIWTGGTVRGGYGVIKYDGKMVLVHRISLWENKGPPPTDKHQASHLCHVSYCVNASHLVWDTRSENEMRKSPQIRKAGGKACGVITRKTAKGYCYLKNSKKYRARAWKDGKCRHIGCFLTAADAHASYLAFIGTPS